MEIIRELLGISINPVQIVMVIGVCMFLGALWYSPRMFGSLWAKAQYGESAEMKAGPLQYLGATLVSGTMVFCIALFLSAFRIVEVEYGMLWTFIMWLAFIATSHFSGVIWAKKSLTVYLIDIFYLLISMLVSSTLLILWKK